MTHVDTTFLVDLLRERKHGDHGAAARLLSERLADEELAVSIHVACELSAGAELAANPPRERERVQDVLAPLQIVYPDDGFAPAYGRLLAGLQRTGETIGTMDLLIATAAVRSGSPLVTRNVKHFSRVPGLELIGY